MAAVPAANIETSQPIYGPNGLIIGYTKAKTRSYGVPTEGSQYATLATPNSGVTKPIAAPAIPQFDVTKTVKQPAIAKAIDTTLGQQQAVQTDLNKSFQDYLEEARQLNAQNRAQLSKDQAAFDTTKIEQSLPETNRQYEAAQTNVSDQMAQRNRDYAAQTQATLDKLANENKAYETAAQAVADQAVARAQRLNNVNQILSGTPTSTSGDRQGRALQAYIDVNVPLQRELANRNYDLTANIERPLQRELYGNDQTLLGRQSSLATDYANRDTSTQQYLQQLKMQTAGMSRAQAQSYLQSLQIPFQVAQQIIAGDISNLGAIQALDEKANWYTVSTPYDASRQPAVAYPGYSAPPSRAYPNYPDLGYPQTGTTPGASTPSASTSPAAVAYFQQTGFWPDRDPNFSQATWDAIIARLSQGANRSYSPTPSPAEAYNGRYSGGFTVGADGAVNPTGSLRDYSFSDYDPTLPNGGRNSAERAYYDAVSRSYE